MRNIHPPKHSFLILLIFLIATFTIYPFLGNYFLSQIAFKILFSLILIGAVYVLSSKKSIFLLGIVFMIPTLVFNWISYLLPHASTFILLDVFSILFWFFILRTMIRSIFRQKDFTESLFGSLCVYFIIGLLFADMFSLIENIYPGSFSYAFGMKEIPLQNVRQIQQFIYFSFVTLTTLGYGDITPLILPAKFLSILEAILGQLYIAVMIGRFVGISLQKDNLP